jgi:hypothetical protein
MGWAGIISAYPERHGPFSDNAEIERIALTRLIRVSENPNLDGPEPEAVFEHPDHRKMQLDVYRSEEGRSARLVVNGETVLPLSHISNTLFYAGLTAEAADLNRDGRVDFIIYANYGSCGLAAGYCDAAFILSSGEKYILSSVLTLFPNEADFVILNNEPCFIHTSLLGVERCKDGKTHNFWIYNLLVFGKDGLKVDNSVHDAFPKTIWFSYRPNHAETTLISELQKKDLLKHSLNDLCIAVWAPVERGAFEDADGKIIDRETARAGIGAIPAIKAADGAVVENGGFGIEVYVDDRPREHFKRRYREVSVYEIYHDHHPRLVTFLVSMDGKEILILNLSDVGPRYRKPGDWMETRQFFCHR